MSSNPVKSANQAFRQGDFQAAKAFYQQAAERYGKSLFEVNLILCDQRQKVPGKVGTISVKKQYENQKNQNLNEKIYSLKRQLEEKNANIDERFKELAMLTRMLEQKDADIDERFEELAILTRVLEEKDSGMRHNH